MYSDDDLDRAVEQKIFSSQSVTAFKQSVQVQKDTFAADDEPFKLVSNFNDIFVVIACLLLLFSAKWILESYHPSLAFAAFALISWLLAEIFIAKKKMALPAIVLLLSFVGGVFYFTQSFFSETSQTFYVISGAISVFAAYLHWRKFSVPITIAAGAAALTLCLTSLLMVLSDNNITLLMWSLCLCGIGVFTWAMYWDTSDLVRGSYRSDVAFWLHLLSAPLIIHPVFTQLGFFNGNESLWAMASVLALYGVMACVSIAIDRRAFMVSALAYVVYTISTFMENYELTSSSVALTGVVIGIALIALSAYWIKVRQLLLSLLPEALTLKLPPTVG